MPRLLVVTSSCSEALELAPLLRALPAAGLDAVVAWFGSEAALADARELDLPAATRVCVPSVGASAALRHAEAARFAAELLAQGPWVGVLSTGHGTWPLAAGVAASREGVAVVRLGAGHRSHALDSGQGFRIDQARRLADHTGTVWFVASEWQLRQLQAEGLPKARIRISGSLLPAALQALPPPPSSSSAPFAWLAIEHDATVGDRGRLAAMLESVTAAARQVSLPVRAVTTVLGPALERTGLAPPPGMSLATGASAMAQLQALRGARLLLTDSAGYQELAMAAGVPCVVLPGASARTDLVAIGACQLASTNASSMAATFAWALQVQPIATPRATDAIDVLVAELPALLAPAREPAATAVASAIPNLPSDGDASGRTLGEDEVVLAAAAIRSGTLNSTRGTFVATFEQRFAAWLGRKHAIACASGSAAVHCAIAALRLQPGDEVITTPITDMGALTPILFEGAVPVFADVDARTLNVTAHTIRAQLTSRTRAIVVTHLFGMPCELDAILTLAREHDLPVIEDAAQAFGATYAGRKVGTFGALAAFSLQQGKHITTGEGGIVATDDDDLARRVFLCVNKAWGYGDRQPDHYFPALNYRLTELQGAVAVAQLPKLDWVVARRREVAAALAVQLAAVPGLHLPSDPAQGTHSYWKFAFFVDPQLVEGGAQALGQRMQKAGVACAPRYIQKPAFECALFADWRNSPVTWLPLQHNPRRDAPQPLFERAKYPGTTAALERVVVLPINERYEPSHIAAVAAIIRAATAELQHA
ncbi:MAG: DegT/DnrJ/EryC1/StrS family aminotransferase [Planctomycetota bacterium]